MSLHHGYNCPGALRGDRGHCRHSGKHERAAPAQSYTADTTFEYVLVPVERIHPIQCHTHLSRHLGSCGDEGCPVVSLRARNVSQFAGFLYNGGRGSGALLLGWRQSLLRGLSESKAPVHGKRHSKITFPRPLALSGLAAPSTVTALGMLWH